MGQRILFLRGGYRMRTLPFQASGQDVNEKSITAGLGTAFAANHVLGRPRLDSRVADRQSLGDRARLDRQHRNRRSPVIAPRGEQRTASQRSADSRRRRRGGERRVAVRPAARARLPRHRGVGRTGALAACFEHRPDLCILDVSMPAGDLGVDDRSTGFEVCRRIKRDPRTKSIPVIFVTALNDTTDRVKAIEAGGDDFLTKPHNRLVLGARVRSLLKLKAATDSLEDTLRKLREVEKMRDDLMKMIVHDLKTPLTSVLATTEMLIDGDFGPLNDAAEADARRRRGEGGGSVGADRRPARGVAHRGGDDDARSPADRAGRAAQRDRARVVDSLSAGARRRDRRRRRRCAGLRGRQALLKRVLGNLVQNALTHSATAVTLQLIGAARRRRRFCSPSPTTDPGIPPEYHEVIFRKFERVKNPNMPRTRSSGLGLAFCKLVVDAHGGRIWVQSAGEGKGARSISRCRPSPLHREVRVTAGGAVPA